MTADESIDDFCAYLIECERSPNTICSYTAAVRQFYKFSATLDKLSVLRWKKELMLRHSPATVNLRLSALRCYCKYSGVDCDIKLLKMQRRSSIENVITIEQYHALIAGLHADGSLRWEAYYKILAMTGMRVNELLNVRRADLDGGVMTVFAKGKVRRIIFPARLIDEIKSVFCSMPPDEYICVNQHGRRLTARGIRAMLKRHAARYGIPGANAHPHSFRHLFAIEFLRREKNIALLADLLGHSSLNTTSIYLRLSLSQQQQALNKTVTW